MDTTTANQNLSYLLTDDNTTTDEDYTYDVSFQPYQICVMLMYIIIILLGLIGNALVIFAICKRRRQNVTSLLLCSLALSDLVMVVIFMPFKVADYFVFSWKLGWFMCNLVSYVALVTPACSGCMLMVISLERYIVILYPLRARSFLTKTRAVVIVVIAWSLSLVLAVPAILYQKHERHSDGADVWYVCSKRFPNSGHMKLYALYCFVILYLIPLFVMGFSYTRVIQALHSSAITSKGLQQQSANSSTERPNNIYKPQPIKKVSAPSGDNPSGESDPFPLPEVTSQQPRHNEGVPTTTAPSSHVKPKKVKKGQANDRRQVIIMLMVVVLLYAVCWGPVLLVSIFIRFGILDEYSDPVYYASMICHILAFTNSTVNPIVYGFMSRNFRRTVVSALKSCCGGSCGGLGKNTNNSTCNSRYYSTATCNSVAVAAPPSTSLYVKRDHSSGGQAIEMTQYVKVPNDEG